MKATTEEVYYYIGNCMSCDLHTEEFSVREQAEEWVRDHNDEQHSIT